MSRRQLSLKDKDYITRFLHLRRHDLSVYAFENIYIWKELFEITWMEADGNLCIFFEDALSRFLYLPPLGKSISPDALKVSFEVMDERNANRDVSRVENIEEEDCSFFKKHGYSLYLKSHDYVCLRKEMQELRGNTFKSKRSSYNYFIHHYAYECRPYTPGDAGACLGLYEEWMQERMKGRSDAVYCGMLRDSRRCLGVLIDSAGSLDAEGMVVLVDGRIKGFTFGFPVNPDTWCVVYEVADLSVKGCAQFIFRHFCSRMDQYRFINVMDDSGLENLRRVKMSYCPVRRVPAYNAKRLGA